MVNIKLIIRDFLLMVSSIKRTFPYFITLRRSSFDELLYIISLYIFSYDILLHFLLFFFFYIIFNDWHMWWTPAKRVLYESRSRFMFCDLAAYEILVSGVLYDLFSKHFIQRPELSIIFGATLCSAGCQLRNIFLTSFLLHFELLLYLLSIKFFICTFYIFHCFVETRRFGKSGYKS